MIYHLKLVCLFFKVHFNVIQGGTRVYSGTRSEIALLLKLGNGWYLRKVTVPKPLHIGCEMPVFFSLFCAV